VAAFDTDRLERVLGPTWPAMDFLDLGTRAHDLEAAAEFRAAGFTRALIRYMNQAGSRTAGEALATLTARQPSGSHPPP
jgi:hypothetical protein